MIASGLPVFCVHKSGLSIELGRSCSRLRVLPPQGAPASGRLEADKGKPDHDRMAGRTVGASKGERFSMYYFLSVPP